MGKLLLTIGIILYAFPIRAQDIRAIEIKGEWREDKFSHDAINQDYCPYYLPVDLSRMGGFMNLTGSTYSTTVSGRSTMTMYSLRPFGTGSVSTGVTYRYYRGNIDAKLNIDFQYALPIKQGTTTSVSLQDNSDYSIIFDLSSSVDTVYACRGGFDQFEKDFLNRYSV